MYRDSGILQVVASFTAVREWGWRKKERGEKVL